jgi:hypothetical protein
MPIDPNIALQGQSPQFANPLDMATKAMTLSSLSMKNTQEQQSLSDDQATRKAFADNIITNPDGSTTLNRQGALSDLAKTAPTKAVALQQQFATNDIQSQEARMGLLTKQAELGKQLAWGIDVSAPPEVKQAQWTKMIQTASAYKLPNADTLSPQYPGDDFVKSMQYHTLTAAQQMEQANKNKEFNLKSQDLALQRQKFNFENDQKDVKDLQDHLQKGWTARSGQAGIVQGKLNAAERAEQLIAQGKNQEGGLDSRQMEELAQSASNLLGGGSQASARVEALLPHTAAGKVQSLKEYLSNLPQGANQSAFTDRLAETIEREKQVANDQKRQYQVEGLPRFQRLAKSQPTVYNSMLEAAGVDPSMIGPKGQYKKSGPASQFSQDVIDYASTHGITPQQAQALKMKRGGQ